MNLSSLKEKQKYFGLRKALFFSIYLVTNKLFYFKIFKFLYITPAMLNEKFNKNLLQNYVGFLFLEQILNFVNDKKNDLDKIFVYEAFNKGDSCMAAIDDNGIIMGYVWYSSKSTKITDDLILNFPTDYIYSYKHFTRPEFRGKSITAYNLAKALNFFSEKGYKGFILYVDITNYASLNSVYKTGFEDIGKVYISRILGNYFIYISKKCRAFKIYLNVKK